MTQKDYSGKTDYLACGMLKLKSVLIRLKAVKKYLPQSVLLGSVLALVCTLWSTYWSVYYATPWVEAWMIFRSYLTFWTVWSLAMSVVLPAILSDEFSA